MKSTKTREKELNKIYSDCYSEDDAVEDLIYLTNKNRSGKVTTVNTIRKHYRNATLGTLLKRLDSIRFNTF
jgi:hypothetical protein